MSTDVPGSSTELATHACWALLRAVDLGRLAITSRGEPDIFPVNYAVDRGSIVFRTGVGTKLAITALGGRVAFEVDGFDNQLAQAWSVVVKGRARVIQNLDEALSVADLPLFPAHDSPKHHFIRIEPEQITGRRFTVADPGRWRTLLTDATRTALE